MDKIKTLTIIFNNEISQQQIPLFRGAIIDTMDNANILFHNHDEDNLRYSYPLIQYKRIHKNAAIVCIGEGTEAIGSFFSSYKSDICLGQEPVHLEIKDINANECLIQIWQDMFSYRINQWIPLNHNNYLKYKDIDGIVDKYAMLEGILTGNILSFAKGVGIYFDQKVVCKITDISASRLTRYKGVELMSFDATFKCNVSLPNHIGLGKGVSIGNGTIATIDNKSEEK
jgi:hypothetical protein